MTWIITAGFIGMTILAVVLVWLVYTTVIVGNALEPDPVEHSDGTPDYAAFRSSVERAAGMQS